MRWSLVLGLFLVCIFSLLIAGVFVATNPAPQTIEFLEDGASVYLSVDRTRFIFPSGCATAEWRLEGIREVAFYNIPVTGAERQSFCTGDFPRLRVVFGDGIARTYTLNRDVLMLNPFAQTAGILALALGVLLLYQFVFKRLVETVRGQYLAALVIAVGLVALAGLYTRAEYIRVHGTLDAAYVRDIGLYGWLDNPNQTAPWAYRPVTALTARAVSGVLGQPLDAGFWLVTFASMVAQLVLIFALARHFGANFRAGVLTMLFIALAYYNLRGSMADIYREDSPAYALMLLAILMLFQNRIGWCIVVCSIGILTREFLAIPAALLGIKLVVDLYRRPSARTLGWLVVAAAAFGAVVILPRAFVPVVRSAQIFDPQHNPDALGYLLTQPLRNVPRNIEFLTALLSYLLPILLLATPARLRRAWDALAGYRTFFALYTLLVLLLTMYGGSSIHRYVTFLFVIEIVLLAIWLRDVSWREALAVLLVTAVANRLFWMPGVDPITSALVIGSSNAPQAVRPRILEIVGYWVIAVEFRILWTISVPKRFKRVYSTDQA